MYNLFHVIKRVTDIILYILIVTNQVNGNKSASSMKKKISSYVSKKGGLLIIFVLTNSNRKLITGLEERTLNVE